MAKRDSSKRFFEGREIRQRNRGSSSCCTCRTMWGKVVFKSVPLLCQHFAEIDRIEAGLILARLQWPLELPDGDSRNMQTFLYAATIVSESRIFQPRSLAHLIKACMAPASWARAARPPKRKEEAAGIKSQCKPSRKPFRK